MLGYDRSGVENKKAFEEDEKRNNLKQEAPTSRVDIEGKHDEPAKDPHAHKSGPVQWAASSVVCFVIYFFFCIVFASVVFDPLVSDSDPPFGVAQGVSVNLLGIAVGSLFFSRLSGCKGVLGGPDLLPIIFAAECGTAVTAYLERVAVDAASVASGDGCDDGGGYGYADNDDGGSYADDGGYSSSSHERRLAGSTVSILNKRERAMVIPTTLVAMVIGNVLTGLVFLALGKMKSTATAIGFIPSSVISGFL